MSDMSECLKVFLDELSETKCHQCGKPITDVPSIQKCDNPYHYRIAAKVQSMIAKYGRAPETPKGICPGYDSNGIEVPYGGMPCDCYGCSPSHNETPCNEGSGCTDCEGPATGCADYRITGIDNSVSGIAILEY